MYKRPKKRKKAENTVDKTKMKGSSDRQREVKWGEKWLLVDSMIYMLLSSFVV